MLLAFPLFAADVRLEWDAKPADQTWTAVRIYEVTDGKAVQVAEVAGDAVRATLADVKAGSHIYFARSVNVAGESDNSNQVEAMVPNLPNPPANMRYEIIISIKVVPDERQPQAR